MTLTVREAKQKHHPKAVLNVLKGSHWVGEIVKKKDGFKLRLCLKNPEHRNGYSKIPSCIWKYAKYTFTRIDKVQKMLDLFANAIEHDFPSLTGVPINDWSQNWWVIEKGYTIRQAMEKCGVHNANSRWEDTKGLDRTVLIPEPWKEKPLLRKLRECEDKLTPKAYKKCVRELERFLSLNKDTRRVKTKQTDNTLIFSILEKVLFNRELPKWLGNV